MVRHGTLTPVSLVQFQSPLPNSNQCGGGIGRRLRCKNAHGNHFLREAKIHGFWLRSQLRSCEVQILTRIVYICSHLLIGLGSRTLNPAMWVQAPLGVPKICGAVDELVESPPFQGGI